MGSLKKGVALTLVVGMGCGLVACSTEGNKPGSGEAAVGKSDGTPIELHIISRRLGVADEQNAVKDELEKKFNVKLKWEIKPSADYDKTSQAILAAGSYPDMMEIHWTDAQKQIKQFAEDKVLVDLTPLLDKFGPNIKKWRPEKETWYYPLGDNHVYTIPSRFNEFGIEGIYTIRQDWLDKLGLKMPTNLNELFEVAKAFTFKDPDGNGKNDTYGFGHGVNGNKSLTGGTPFDYIMNSYGIVSGWNNVNGKLVNNAIMPEMKEAIKYYRNAFQEGLVEPEFPILSREKYLERKNQNKYGIESWWTTHLDTGESAWWRDFTKNVPGAKVSYLAPFAAKDGKKTFPRMGLRSYSPSVAIFTKDAKKAEKAMQILDYLASDEGAELAAFGVKGKNWEESNGKIVVKQQSEEETRKSGAYLYSWVFRQKIYMRNTNDEVMKAVNTYKDILVKPVEIDATPAQTQYGKALGDLTNNRLMKIVIDKEVDIDGDFDKFVKEWLAAGGQKMTDEANAEFAKKK